MGWRDLLTDLDTLVSPWVGGQQLRSGPRAWTIEGPAPEEYGWYTFKLTARSAWVGLPAEPQPLPYQMEGYLAGDRLVPDGVRPGADPRRLLALWPKVHLLEPLDRFSRVACGRTHEDGALIYLRQSYPLGPEDEVQRAYEEQLNSLDEIKGVPPALDAAFRMETWHRAETERRRLELARRRQEEEARRAVEERRQAIAERLGDAAGRREMARVDFGEAARAALAVGGAVYLDHRPATRRGEFAVRFRFLGRRLECVCDEHLQITDSGACLTAHYDDPDFAGGTKGDTWFTLESLPSVLAEAEAAGKLVIYRHVD